MNTTVRMKASQIYKDWHVIDATGRSIGRVASEAAILLRGKHKPTYEPHLDDGDFVIVVNASQVRMTGRKREQIKYYTHSGFPGGLKTRSFEEQFARHPERVIEAAVWGMLPGGALGKAMLKHLKVYRGSNHPHASQVTGSERAKAVREALQAETLLSTVKPPRLRPLSIPESAVAPVVEPPVAVVAAPAAPVKRVRKAAPVIEAPAEPAVAEAPVATPAVEEAVAAAPTPAEAEAPKRRAPRKKAESVAEAPAETPVAESASEEAPKKPARRRAAAKQEE